MVRGQYLSRTDYKANDCLLKAYISGNALVILSGPHTLIQTIYGDELLALESVAVDETSGKIAVCTTEEVHIYKPYGKKEGALKVRSEKSDSRPPFGVLTSITVVISVVFTDSKMRQRYVDSILGFGGGTFNRFQFSEALPDGG